jgi:prolipoprotein diacylglyceryltransferase
LGVFSMGQVLCFLMIVVGAGVYLFRRGREAQVPLGKT